MKSLHHLDVSGRDIQTIHILRTQWGVKVLVSCARCEYSQEYSSWDQALYDVIALQSWVQREHGVIRLPAI